MAYNTTLLIHEVLNEFQRQKTQQEKINILRKHKSPALLDLLRCSFDERIIFQLPDGTPPYVPAQVGSVPNNLLKQNMKLTYWVKGGKGDIGKVNKIKRERIFLDVLESIHPEDAKVLILAKDKKPLCKGLTAKLVKEAFPGLLPD